MQCPSCKSTIEPTDTGECPVCGESIENRQAAETVPDAVSPASAPSGSPAEEAPVLEPGETIAGGRYRILRVLGVGGMGQVYHAQDLKLGQPVALKVLKGSLANKASCVEKLRSEVRLARSIAHPNICRVYDLADHNGVSFLTMEYIDGEDLSSLLKRVGRLNREHALRAARQLASGLQAAHERGILHRDIKPANVMVDAQGNMRLTDFGIAAAVDQAGAEGGSPGTPAYMAPEVLSGGVASVQSDLFGLGLVLYELATGHPVYSATTMTELFQQHRREEPRPPSMFVDVHPELERITLLCLQRDPTRRPSTALAVMAELPGGDPLRAALAAGETPSPELVAASGGSGQTPWRTVMALSFGLFLGLAVLLVFARYTKLTSYVDMPVSTEVLAYEARTLTEQLGYPGEGRYEAWGYEVDRTAVTAARNRALEGVGESSVDREPERWWWDRAFRNNIPEPIRFFYRQSNQPIVARRLAGRVTWSDPPMDALNLGDAGGLRLKLAPNRKLRELRALPVPLLDQPVAGTSEEDGPPGVERSPDENSTPLEDVSDGDVQWPVEAPDPRVVLFEAAGLDMDQFHATPPRFAPHTATNEHEAWLGKAPDNPNLPVYVEFGSFAGRPVLFRVMSSAEVTLQANEIRDGAEMSATPSSLAVTVLDGLINFGTVAVALVLTWIAVSRGRYDAKGGARVAIGTVALVVCGNLMHGNNLFGGRPEQVDQLFNAFARAVLIAGHTWLFYVALESQVRRVWPEMLIGWVRLLDGRFRDPLVGRGILVGLCAGVLGASILHLDHLLPKLIYERDYGLPVYHPVGTMEALAGGRLVVASILESSVLLFRYALIMITLLLVIRFIVRSRWLAVGAFVLLQAILFAGSVETTVWSKLLFAALAVVVTFAVVRYGLLTGFVAGWTWALLHHSPLVVDPGHPAFGSSMLVLSLIACLGIYGGVVALGPRTQVLLSPRTG